MKKQQKVEKWREIQEKQWMPTPIEQWTDDLEQQLLVASSKDSNPRLCSWKI